MCQKDTSLQKQLMIITSTIASSSQSLKAIQVQLTLKGGQFGQFEILRQKLDELFGFVNHKAAAMGLPRDDVLVSIGAHRIQHIVQLEGKGRGNTTSGRSVFLVIRAAVMSVVMIVVLNHNVWVLGRVGVIVGIMQQAVLQGRVNSEQRARTGGRCCGSIHRTTALESVRWEWTTIADIRNAHGSSMKNTTILVSIGVLYLQRNYVMLLELFVKKRY
mmetsp:Transcript_896/g.1418  ORF Transcript_896/g.1418 Transcript_896/m.1418 type:complete len:217 (+) Transcript_896:600-1250(+)